ncbi:hypothetical protein OPQ81_000204 [Rhizoctonia solani]|nr:hypothetical protein OPQ81_000204 [Rhizoctonia solani]
MSSSAIDSILTLRDTLATFGISSCHAWLFHVIRDHAMTHNLAPFMSIQNHHIVFNREKEREVFPTLEYFGVGIILINNGLLKKEKEPIDVLEPCLPVSQEGRILRRNTEPEPAWRGLPQFRAWLKWRLNYRDDESERS